MNKRVIGIGILGAALLGTIGVAQERRQGRPDGRGDGAVAYLGLTEGQQEQWRSLHAQHRESMAPLMEEMRALRQRVQQSLEADEPEVLVGEAVKALHAQKKQIEAAREAFQAQLAAVLTPEQQEKFEALQAAREVDRGTRLHRRRRGPRGPRASLEG